MRQKYQTNVPEQGNPHHPFSVQGKGDGWAVFDASTGGWTGTYDTYKRAEEKAKELFDAKQRAAAANVKAFFNSRSAA
ncbi:hypothetical protein BGV67_02905 [Burkholderia ubonensis]|uniref:hypothetical protein n=1 Tax=Burkholderia ubonensis TaxID=101571 RepID=UPI00075B84CA|nr:hypothetical protein [Burkholderia ubonensis]KVD50581.1 hypothetical protein WI86_15790 [Burkholderia ubonensis]KWK67209.1 hypothetical protein WM15_07325 [Burkholderia ubonensis]OJA76075.1 hypothetical protein BGV67_02905 [Burkholderia ubonensis]OJB36517.1 hypothetical protein BGV57_26025 [Burkholderia ubonensis]